MDIMNNGEVEELPSQLKMVETNFRMKNSVFSKNKKMHCKHRCISKTR
jgi:hypothetical protein